MRPALAAISLANLFLVRIWTELLGEQTEEIPPIWYGAALLNLLALSLLIWAIARWGGFAGRVALAVGGSLLLAKELTMAVGHDATAMKSFMAGLVAQGLRQGWLVPAGVVAALALAWVAWRTQLRWAPPLLEILCPIVVVTAGQAAWRATLPPPPQPITRMSQPGKFKPGPRVVWVIFDEFDERIVFSRRPAGLKLPALDALRDEAIAFPQAFSPSNSTADSIPALLGDLFERSQSVGIRSGVVGWFLPYCRKYGASLAECRSWRMDLQRNSYALGLFGAVGSQLRSLFESSLYSIFGQSITVEAHGRTVLEMEAAAVALAGRGDLNLVFLHLPVPHPPYVYNPVRRDLSARNQDERGYLANLELADRMLGKIRAGLEASGLWTGTNVLVSGDHGFRQARRIGYSLEDRHVPLLWKPAGAKQTRVVSQRFETIQTAGLISRLLGGEPAESMLAGYP